MARKVSDLTWKTLAEAVKAVGGEEKALAYLKKGVADFEYRSERNKESQELLKLARKNPKFKDILKNRTGAA